MSQSISVGAKILWVLSLGALLAWYGWTRLGGRSASFIVEPVSNEVARVIHENNDSMFAVSTGHRPVVVYSHYFCPFCRELWDSVESLVYDGTDLISVAVYVRHLVEPDDPTYYAALAAECAAEQGEFRSYNREIYAQVDTGQRQFTPELLQELADGIVTDLTKFSTCLNEEVYNSHLVTAGEEARLLAVRGTPVTVVGKQAITGTPARSALRSMFEQGKEEP
ncbi:DsbA family protein [Candidatus Palauibacter sp.]|uniref:DsbA family protein n=1 Tax=Candidatus Palauibacter sp. TaxID=3101350 RepID=UPI003B023508